MYMRPSGPSKGRVDNKVTLRSPATNIEISTLEDTLKMLLSQESTLVVAERRCQDLYNENIKLKREAQQANEECQRIRAARDLANSEVKDLRELLRQTEREGLNFQFQAVHCLVAKQEAEEKLAKCEADKVEKVRKQLATFRKLSIISSRLREHSEVFKAARDDAFEKRDAAIAELGTCQKQNSMHLLAIMILENEKNKLLQAFADTENDFSTRMRVLESALAECKERGDSQIDDLGKENAELRTKSIIQQANITSLESEISLLLEKLAPDSPPNKAPAESHATKQPHELSMIQGLLRIGVAVRRAFLEGASAKSGKGREESRINLNLLIDAFAAGHTVNVVADLALFHLGYTDSNALDEAFHMVYGYSVDFCTRSLATRSMTVTTLEGRAKRNRGIMRMGRMGNLKVLLGYFIFSSICNQVGCIGEVLWCWIDEY